MIFRHKNRKSAVKFEIARKMAISARGRPSNFRPKAVMKFELIENEQNWFRRFISRNEICP